MSKVIITGILGQDGANMAEYLLDATNHEIVGTMRHSNTADYANIKSILNHPRFSLEILELKSEQSINNIIKREKPDYFINFAASSFVGDDLSAETLIDTNSTGVLRCLESIRVNKPDCRFFSAGSSEEFGAVEYSPQDIEHPSNPKSLYGVSKAHAARFVRFYRENHGMYAVHGVMFNHEGPKRGGEFVSRKITAGVARISREMNDNHRRDSLTPVELGNLDARRDWSDSRDFVKGVWIMLNQDEFRMKPTGEVKDYILASGRTSSVRYLFEKAMEAICVKGRWKGEGLDEIYVLPDHLTARNWTKLAAPLVRVNPKFYRESKEIRHGDSLPIRAELGWGPEISLDKMIEDMVSSDLNELKEKEAKGVLEG